MVFSWLGSWLGLGSVLGLGPTLPHLEGIGLEELAQILDRRADLSEDEELLEGAHQRAARLVRGRGSG